MRNSEAFTLIEITVSVGILLIVSALILASYPKLGDNADLTQAAKIVESSIRKAEFYGLGVRETSGSFPAYGLFFGPLPAVSYILFADINGNNTYEPLGGEKIETYSIYKIAYIPDASEGGGLCGIRLNPLETKCDLTALNIIFRRPNPDIFLYGEDDWGAIAEPFDKIEITVKSSRGNSKKVVVWRSGQISTE